VHHTGPGVAHSDRHTIVGPAVPFWHVTNDWGLWCIQEQVPYNWLNLYSHILARCRVRSHKLLFSWWRPKVTACRWCRNCNLVSDCQWCSRKCLLLSIFWHQVVVEIARWQRTQDIGFLFLSIKPNSQPFIEHLSSFRGTSFAYVFVVLSRTNMMTWPPKFLIMRYTLKHNSNSLTFKYSLLN
jgi:hypothetical protein